MLSSNISQAKDAFRSQIDGFKKALETDDIAIILSGSKNFRKELDPTYKSNRKGVRKPLGFRALLDWLPEEYQGLVRKQDLLEADDYIGILATTPGSVERIVVSEDKDFRTVPCKLYKSGELETIDEATADLNLLKQALTGDPADGYKGCPGIGPVKAEQILNKAGDPWENVVQAFTKAGFDEEYALQQTRLARILRHGDWDSATQSVKLWSPYT